jgi:hypothetical protein
VLVGIRVVHSGQRQGLVDKRGFHIDRLPAFPFYRELAGACIVVAEAAAGKIADKIVAAADRYCHLLQEYSPHMLHNPILKVCRVW